jgi:hypothetical protein
MSGELATPVATAKGRARLGSVRLRFSSAAARLSRLPSQITALPSRLPSQITAIRSRLPSEQVVRSTLAELRMPDTADPAVRQRRLLGASAWAFPLGLVGMFIGARIVFGIFTEMPLWYWFLLIVLGIPGVAATLAAFAILHKDRLPWQLLGIATAAETLVLLATIAS